MEKPSLEIGNGNWAIKENNLLGYANVDGMILPDPITVTRATLATRVNPSGLIEDVELLGGDLVTNGDFELNSNWNNFGSPTTSEQSTEQSHTGTYSWKIIADATQEGIFSPNNFNLTNGLTYTVSLWIYSVSGNSIKSGLNNTSQSVFTERTVTVGEWTNITYEATATSTGASYISILSQNSLNFFVDNVTVKEVTRNGLAKIDYTDGTANLLVEPARTNTVTYSEKISQYTHVGLTIIDNDTTSPSGLTSASKITETDGGSLHYAGVSLSGAAAEYSWSCFLKQGTVRYAGMRAVVNGFVNRFFVNVDLSNGSVVDTNTVGSGVTWEYSVEEYSNNWYRLIITAPNTSGNMDFTISPSNQSNPSYSLGLPSHSGDINNYFYAWGAQFEQGSYPTSYIKTHGATAARAQDVITKTGISDKINSTEGVLFFETAFLNDTGNYKSVTLSDGTTANRITFENRPVANQIKVFVCVSGTNVMQSTQTLTDVKAFNKIAIKWKQNDFAWWVNGVKIYTDTSGNTFSANTLNRLGFDRGDGFTLLEGKVKQLQVYKTALTDLEIESLTSFASFTEMTNALNYTIY